MDEGRTFHLAIGIYNIWKLLGLSLCRAQQYDRLDLLL